MNKVKRKIQAIAQGKGEKCLAERHGATIPQAGPPCVAASNLSPNGTRHERTCSATCGSCSASPAWPAPKAHTVVVEHFLTPSYVKKNEERVPQSNILSTKFNAVRHNHFQTVIGSQQHIIIQWYLPLRAIKRNFEYSKLLNNTAYLHPDPNSSSFGIIREVHWVYCVSASRALVTYLSVSLNSGRSEGPYIYYVARNRKSPGLTMGTSGYCCTETWVSTFRSFYHIIIWTQHPSYTSTSPVN